MNLCRIDVARDDIEAFCRKWQVTEMALFGSVLREDFRPESDIDILIDFAPDAPWTLYEWLDMRDELATLFGRPVDLTSKRALRNPFRKKEIIDSREIIYAA